MSNLFVNSIQPISGATTTLVSASFGTTTSLGSDVVIDGLITSKNSMILTGSLRGEVKVLTVTSQTASLDCSLDNFFTLALVSGSTTHVNPSNILPGQTINILVSQPSVGSGSISFASSVKQVSGSAYVPTAVTSSKDVITLIAFDNSNLYLSKLYKNHNNIQCADWTGSSVNLYIKTGANVKKCADIKEK